MNPTGVRIQGIHVLCNPVLNCQQAQRPPDGMSSNNNVTSVCCSSRDPNLGDNI